MPLRAPLAASRRLLSSLPPLLVLTGLAVAAAPAAHAQQLGEAYARVATLRSAEEPRVPGVFKGPWGVEVAPDGRILVADNTLGLVHVLDRLGQPQALWGEDGSLGKPRDIAAAASAIYVSDPDAGKIHVLSPATGQLRESWTVPGGPSGLAWDAASGRLYVTRGSAGDVLLLDASGATLTRWDGGDAGFGEPWGIAVRPDGSVLVCDIGGGGAGPVLRIFDADGVLQGGFGITLDGTAQAPLDVAVDDDGDIFVIAELAIYRYHDSTPIAVERAPGGRGIAVGPGQGLITTVQDYREGFTGLRRYPDRRRIALTPDLWGGPFSPLGTVEGPRRVSANGDDRLFLLDTWPRVQSWRADGSPLAQFGAGGLHDIAAGARGSVYAIDGRMLTYAGETGDLLWNWQPPGADPSEGNAYSWLTAVDSFDLAGAGNAVAVFDMGDQRLYAIDFSGNPLGEWAVSPPDGFTSIADIALAEGLIYILNRTSGKLEARRLGDGRLEAGWKVPGTALRIDVGQDGSIYALNREGWVIKMAPDGAVLAAWPIEPGAERPPSASDLAVGPAGRVYVALDEASEIAVFEPDAAGQPGELPAFAARCQLDRDKLASPSQIELGFSVQVSLSIDGECPLADGRSDILLLVDTSGSMSGPKMAAARNAALEFVGQLDYSLNQVGLITFSTNVDLVQPLTNNPRNLMRAIPTLGDDSGTNMLEAINLALEEFDGPRARPTAKPVIILLTDGRPSGGADSILVMANGFRAAGRPEIYAIGLGLDVAGSFLRQVATAPNYYFEAPTEYDLTKVYDTIARRVAASVLLQQVTVVDVLPANMRYKAGSAVPAAAYEPASRSLTWSLDRVPPSGLRLRYRVEPLEAGRHPTNVRAVATYVDGLSVSGSLEFPIPMVEVLAPSRWQVYLPLLVKEQCKESHADVVLVIDTSTSMREGDGAKLREAIRAARIFIDQMRLPEDRVALVAFSGEASLVQALSGDQLTVANALDRLPVGAGTRIDLGIDVALGALAERDGSHLPVIVLLTDGRPSGTSAGEVEAAAARAEAAGIRRFTIGLGGDADMALLERVAGNPARAFFAPTADQLAEIYRQIASAIPCQ
ncbi:MAG: VWA domain-containing protein [Caldilineae bacterium]|nr:VWA domain-containing protein [Caldilineae bacterium]